MNTFVTSVCFSMSIPTGRQVNLITTITMNTAYISVMVNLRKGCGMTYLVVANKPVTSVNPKQVAYKLILSPVNQLQGGTDRCS